MKLRVLASTLVCTSLLPGCAMDDAKGPEDGALEEYESKTDSFRNPTEHGPLVFGAAQDAALTDGELFHSWDFELSDDADVALATELVTANLDTVMYLYKKDPDTGLYGSYKFKNDDASDDTLASALNKSLAAGQYRVLVKGFKASLRGSFRVVAECDGAGCQSSSCEVETFASAPAFTGDSCGEMFSAALDAQLSGESGATIILAERCTLPQPVSAAVEYYVDYFGGLEQFNEGFNFGDPDEPVDVEVSWDLFDNGSAYVRVDGGGDEAGMDYLINGDGQVIAHYQHNQSPDHTLYCDGGEEFLEDGECFFEFVETFPHATSQERTSVTTVTDADAADELERPALIAYQSYVQELGLDPDTSVLVDATTWDIDFESSAGRISVRASGQDEFVYELFAATNTQWLFTVKRGAAERAYDCREL